MAVDTEAPVTLIGGVLAAFAALMGLLGWMVKRITMQAFSHTIPRLADTFKEEMAQVRAEHREDREAWRAELRDERQSAERERRMLLDEIRALRGRPEADHG